MANIIKSVGCGTESENGVHMNKDMTKNMFLYKYIHNTHKSVHIKIS